MASILSPLSNKKVTPKFLKELGFDKIVWGSPDFISYSKDGKRRQCKWLKSHQCWELFDDWTNDHWRGDIIYFPPEFDGYVTPFQGNWKDPKHPAGHVYITIANRDDNWEESYPVSNPDDIQLAIAVMKTRMKELDRTVFKIK